MKTFKFFAIAIIALFTVVNFSSCDSSFDEEEFMISKPDNKPDDNNGDDDKDGDWGTILDKTFGTSVDNWTSKIILQKQDGSIVEFKVNLPFSCDLGGDEYTTTETTDASAFVELVAADTTSTPWTADGNGNYLRKITRTQVVKFSKFTRTLVSSHWEAYRFINGKKEYFETATEKANFNRNDQNVSEIENDNKKYERESNLVSMALVFNKENFEAKATTFVDRELKSDETPDTPEVMPDADLNVDQIVKVSELTSSPEYNASNNKIVKWHTVGLIETTDKYYVYVDGAITTSWKKTSLAASSKYNSAMLDGNNWVPAVISMDTKGWTYTCQYADNSYKTRTVDMNLALSSGIKNFTKNNAAEVSPFVKTIVDTKTYSGKKFVSVSAYNVDGRMYLAYTVAEK